ncbi:MAG: AbrB/MazE/SpoVT family DNA-binding domain-containing protein [Verrucomicrobiales bacterium]|jgi:bifunctional DNA-binding transcriptional regulator/antitoxin component of YhaV-PrlF toxin-antitoxin module|nr:AbrB/MazE/SpoVT family DNA-binding domain-containing protein [Verrucomicrobiales bacterium]
MITTVTSKNMVTVPAEIGRQVGIKPGYRLDWSIAKNKPETLTVKVIPTRGELARRLCGVGKKYFPKRDLVAELMREREEDLRIEASRS